MEAKPILVVKLPYETSNTALGEIDRILRNKISDWHIIACRVNLIEIVEFHALSLRDAHEVDIEELREIVLGELLKDNIQFHEQH